MHLGLDIGGANLKASDGENRSELRPFAIWKDPQRLTHELEALLAPWSRWDSLAVTMTAELADCFATKAAGVEAILQSVERLAGGRPVHVWQTAGEFVSPADAREFPSLTAASNWHALATWAGRMAPRDAALLIDVGSTTTDLIPLEAGLPAPQGVCDIERLMSGELLYLGTRRTPLCALTQTVPSRGAEIPWAAELFAATLDIALLTGREAENEQDCDTADGRPATIAAAHSRLAHMLCCDAQEFSLSEAQHLAEWLLELLEQRIAAAAARVLDRMAAPCRIVLFSGSGEATARRALERLPQAAAVEAFSLTSLLGSQHSEAACAFALARLARERLD